MDRPRRFSVCLLHRLYSFRQDCCNRHPLTVHDDMGASVFRCQRFVGRLGNQVQKRLRLHEVLRSRPGCCENSRRAFFLDAAEGNDLITDEIGCADLSGWLIRPEDVAVFEPFWSVNEESMPDRFTAGMVIAHWPGALDSISIDFEFYNSWTEG